MKKTILITIFLFIISCEFPPPDPFFLVSISGFAEDVPEGACFFDANFSRYSNTQIVDVGSILHIDPGMTNPMNGNNEWYKLNQNNKVILIGTDGTVLNVDYCSQR